MIFSIKEEEYINMFFVACKSISSAFLMPVHVCISSISPSLDFATAEATVCYCMPLVSQGWPILQSEYVALDYN